MVQKTFKTTTGLIKLPLTLPVTSSEALASVGVEGNKCGGLWIGLYHCVSFSSLFLFVLLVVAVAINFVFVFVDNNPVCGFIFCVLALFFFHSPLSCSCLYCVIVLGLSVLVRPVSFLYYLSIYLILGLTLSWSGLIGMIEQKSWVVGNHVSLASLICDQTNSIFFFSDSSLVVS